MNAPITKTILLKMDYAFQPIYDAKKEEVVGYEALMRPTGKTPEEFIGDAEDLHAIETTTFFCAIREFEKRSLPGKLFLNSFPSESLTNGEFDVLEDMFSKDVMEKLVIELLEYPKIEIDSWEMKRRFIRKNNVQLAIDDFGAGINNVDILLFFNPDIVKLDRSLLKDIDQDPPRQYLMKIAIDLIHKNGIKTLAEGVETKEEYEIMKNIGVDYAQGFYLGKPL